MIDPPMGLVAELTHRCPLQCPYCANPVPLQRAGAELDTAIWQRVPEEAASLGVLQLHFSGGEPTARKDLPELVSAAAKLGLYCNLITSGVLLENAMLGRLAQAGLDHVQISFQDTEPTNGDRISGFAGGHARKCSTARVVRRAGLALTWERTDQQHTHIAHLPVVNHRERGLHAVEQLNHRQQSWRDVDPNCAVTSGDHRYPY
jgi:pyrroloquinoline quinone biosynthesis protein E